MSYIQEWSDRNRWRGDKAKGYCIFSAVRGGGVGGGGGFCEVRMGFGRECGCK